MALAATYRRALRERALDQHGYVTTRDAEALGIPAAALRQLAGRGGLQHVARGLYRFDDVPHSGKEQFMEAVLSVGPDAYLTGDAVLALHDLALVNPRRLRVAVRHRPRRNLPEFVEVVNDENPDTERTFYDGIPSVTVSAALRESRGVVMHERLVEATKEAARIGLIRQAEATALLRDFGAAHA